MTEEENTEVQETEPQEKLDKGDLLQVIANALKIGSITSQQAASMRAELGVFGSDFTKSSQTKADKKKKRKAQKKARAVTRSRGFKGQKAPSGSLKRSSGRGR